MQKRVTLSLDSESYKKFQKFCENNDVIVSKKIERLMNNYLEEESKIKGGKK